MDVPALRAFSASHAEGRFAEALFAQNLYYGAYEDAHLVAAGGTHVQAQRARLAVLGAILSAPHARRQGYALAITSALIAHLYAQGFPLVVLNVFRDNDDAIRLYQRLGFRAQHRMLTGKGVRAQICQLFSRVAYCCPIASRVLRIWLWATAYAR
jgi:predicted GNAT family acetyltransferase